MVTNQHAFEMHQLDKQLFPYEFILSFSLCHTHIHTRARVCIHTLTQRRGVVYLMDILLLLNKFLMSCCGLTGALHSIPHAQTLFRCGLAKCAFNPKFSN